MLAAIKYWSRSFVLYIYIFPTFFGDCSYMFLNISWLPPLSIHIWTWTRLDCSRSRASKADLGQFCPWSVWKTSWFSFNTKNVRFLRIADSTLFCWTKLMLVILRYFSHQVPGDDLLLFLSQSLGMPFFNKDFKLYPCCCTIKCRLYII